MKNRTHRARGGFTLMEILISSVIFGVAILSSFGLMRFVIRATDFSGRMNVANELAQSKIEALRASGATANGTETSTNAYTVAWTISVSNGLRTITVNASFKDVAGKQSQVTLRTMTP